MSLKRHVEIEKFGGGYTPLLSPLDSSLTKAQGIVSKLGSYVKRPGRHKLGTAPTTSKILDIDTVKLKNVQVTFAFTSSSIYQWDENTTSWVDVTPTDYAINTSTVGKAQFADSYYVSQRSPAKITGETQLGGIMSRSTNLSNVRFTPVANTPGAKWLAGYAGRLFALAPRDPDGNDYPTMVRYSAPLMPTVFYDTLQGSGYVDLADDGYPVECAFPYGGRLYILKGDSFGGSTYTITATSDPTFPIVYERIFSTGIRGRRTLVKVSSAQYYFIGTDNIYEFQSGQLNAIGQSVAQEIIDNLDSSKLEDAFAFYDHDTSTVTFVVPTTSSMLAYTYDIRTNTWTGPDDYTGLTAASIGTHASEVTWDEMDSRGTTWDDVQSDGSTWDDMYETGGKAFIAVGKNDGTVYEQSSSFADDDGAAVPVEIITGSYTFDGVDFRKLRSRLPVQVGSGDLVGVDGMIIRYKGSATLTISISTDVGETWTQVWSGTLPNNPDFDYATIDFPMIVGSTFMIKFTNSSSTETWSLNKHLVLRAMYISQYNTRRVV